MPREIEIVSLLSEGRVSYDAAFALQKEAEARVKGGGREALFLLEHREVITVGRNAGRGDLAVSEAFLAKQGIELRTSDRGGRLTYHGPGQLVAYPILDLSPDLTDVRKYVRALEEVLILAAADFGVASARSPVPERWSSVWVGNDKLAAIGIHLSRWVSTHGVALNVTTDLARFSLFTPCGIRDGGVTSLAKELASKGEASTVPSVERVAERFVARFGEVFVRVPMAAVARLAEPVPAAGV